MGKFFVSYKGAIPFEKQNTLCQVLFEGRLLQDYFESLHTSFVYSILCANLTRGVLHEV